MVVLTQNIYTEAFLQLTTNIQVHKLSGCNCVLEKKGHPATGLCSRTLNIRTNMSTAHGTNNNKICSMVA